MHRGRQVAGVVALAMFVFHLACTILYLLPRNPLSNTYQPLTSRYMEPIFSQSWQLFAPEPATYSLKLWYRYDRGNGWTDWRDPIHSLVAAHQHNRFSANGKLLRIYEHMTSEVAQVYSQLRVQFRCVARDTLCLNRMQRSWEQEEIYASINRFLSALAQKEIGPLPDGGIKVQYVVVKLYPNQFSARTRNTPFGFAEYLEFPPVLLGTSPRHTHGRSQTVR